jgi:hypothetical protein
MNYRVGRHGDSKEVRHGKPPRQIPRWLVLIVGLVFLSVVVAGAVIAYVLHNAEPILKQRVIATLEDRFKSPVQLDELHISLLQGLQVSGSGLRIFYFGENDKPGSRADDVAPMLVVNNFEFRTGLMELFQSPMRVRAVQVQGMQLRIPPKQERGPLLHDEKKELRGEQQVKPKRSIVLNEIVGSDMTLTIETNQPGKKPLVFEIHDIKLHDVGPEKPFPFDAQLVNAKPVGDIHSTGHFGPWHSDEPRETPVSGDYSFTNADLGTIKGISGTLSSTGTYGGTLGEIAVNGTTDTPNFALDVSEHPVNLKTSYNATVDGTTGNTILNSVHATLLHTVLQVSGMVLRAGESHAPAAAGAIPGDNPQDVPGHVIDISVLSDQARIEDLLSLGVKTNPPLMHGPMTLRAHLQIPPGRVSVSRKMKVQGTFAIHAATFTNPHWQQTLDKLSERATGNPEQANTQDAKLVRSDMSGSFVLANATLDVSNLKYQMPGTQVDLAGKYSLDGQKFDFDGTVRTQATASQMLTGWKSILAMPFDPLLKKNGAGLEVPIKIDGTRSDPKFGIELGKLGKQITSRHKDREAQAPEPKQ